MRYATAIVVTWMLLGTHVGHPASFQEPAARAAESTSKKQPDQAKSAEKKPSQDEKKAAETTPAKKAATVEKTKKQYEEARKKYEDAKKEYAVEAASDAKAVKVAGAKADKAEKEKAEYRKDVCTVNPCLPPCPDSGTTKCQQ